ncbi:MAG: Sec-independent protein translocase subunit TatA [Gammaproteobacteria bacterium]
MGIGFKELVVILIIVLVLFGAKRLRNIGTDLGGAIKGFRQSMKEGEDEDEPAAAPKTEGRIIEGESDLKQNDKVPR